MNRPRLTIRRLMYTVAALGVVMGLDGMRRRREEYSARVAYHAREYRERLRPPAGAGMPPAPIVMASARYHFKLAEKYGQAARYPWITVDPDPPEPE